MTTISSGQSVTGTPIGDGQTLDVLSGGTAIDITIFVGGQEILHGGTDSGAEIAGNQTVSSGGHANGAFVGRLATQAVSAGGVASHTTVVGTQIVYAGGVSSDTVVTSTAGDSPRPTAVVSGGLAFATSVTAGAELDVTSAGSAIDAQVDEHGFLFVSSGGVIISAVLGSPTSVAGFEPFAIDNIFSGGTAIGTTLASAGLQVILDGATATGTIVLSGGEEEVEGISYNESLLAGGTLVAEGTNVYTESAGTVHVLAGLIEGNGFIVQSGPGTLDLTERSNPFRGIDIIAGGTLELTSANTIDQATIQFRGNTGTLRIDGAAALSNPISGMISGTAIDITDLPYVAGGTTTVSGDSVTITEGARHQTLTIVGASTDGQFTLAPDAAGATVLTNDAVIPVISAGDSLTIASGQTSHAVEVLAGGTLTVLSGGTAFTTDDLGQETLEGGTESSGVVSSGGTQTVTDGGLATDETVFSGGVQRIAAGGSATYAEIFAGATQLVVDGAASRTFVSSDGTQTVSSGGVVANAVIFGTSATQNLVGGTDSSALVTGFAVQIVTDGGTDSGGSVTESAVQIIINGGTADGTTIGTAAFQRVFSSGVSISAIIGSGGEQVVSYGGRVISSTVDLGGAQVVSSGGSVTDSTLMGTTNILAGGVISDSIVAGFGEAGIAGGRAVDVTVGGSAHLYVGGTGLATGGVVSGTLVVEDGGSVTDTLIAGGLESILSGGTASATTILSGGFQALTGGIAVDDTIMSGGTVIDNGTLIFTESATQVATIAGKIDGGGGLVQSGPGTLVLAGTTTSFSGSAIVAGGTLELTSAGAAGGGTIAFAGAGGTLQIDAGAPDNLISGFDLGDVIDLAGLAYTTGGTVGVSGNAVTVTEGGTSVTLNIAHAASFNFLLDPDSGSGTELRVACYCPGTAIRTPSGETLIEHLAIGDHVMTADGHPEPIRWIGRRSYAGRFIAGNHLMLPVTIKAGALAEGTPTADLTISPGHAVWIDGQLVPAWRLVNGVSITQAAAVTDVTYLHVELPRHALLLANNTPAESFLDDHGFRGQFQNATEFHASDPDAAPLTPLQPRLEDGFALQAIQDRLNARAGIIPPIEPAGSLRGYLDQAGPQRVCGWAQDVDSPEAPVTLELLVGGAPVLCVLANAYRADLRHAGIGAGCHAFEVQLPDELTGPVVARRVTDGAVLGQTHAANQMQRVA
jgi:autotransporter passenger strand-loop-strand repeat protein/autotransporter-associated beta strand protein